MACRPTAQSMLITLAHIGSKSAGARAAKRADYESLIRLYVERVQPYAQCQMQGFATEAAFLDWIAGTKSSGKISRAAPIPVLLDSRGRQLRSEEFAAWVGTRRDNGAQHLVFAIGPADGWSETALARVRESSLGMLLSLGPMTLAHDLARLVMAEQMYRAFTILHNHPYHSGH
ncbi:23S rRNA (pseudouridine(1915)-N(3))-methyltransferase RlmH [Acidicapsa dinghuensis]|uniref:Ribosomal RNA large subunit methyltransferase H n=1 Tax=Acidicapsa dinghuensis TaxID=2218256 RepID=A0ABW1E9V4_9BACT|nr:23S rRNA (pseudouridine(1915)-N(3))-methyltransferase RlmH [Acidicapsa dinghuensis]